MASPTSRPSANGVGSNGTGSPDRSDDSMLDGGQLRGLSIPSPPHNSVEYKSPDGSWDAGSFDSPRSSVSTSSIESPITSSSNLMKTRSGKMKPKRSQSAYYDEETSTWKCRNCGGTYDMPNPGSRQRREHKKACEETQRLQAIKRAEQEQARREEAAREAVLREQGLAKADNHQEILRGRTDHLLQNGLGHASKVADDPGIIGAFSTTPDIPEIEEVNYEAPKELIHSIERDSSGHLSEAQVADAQSQGSDINGEEPRRGQDGPETDKTEHETMEAFEGRDPPEQNLRAEDQGPGDTTGSPLKVELMGELKAGNDSSAPTSNKVNLQGSLDQHWSDKASPPPSAETPEEFDQVKYCSPAASNGVRLEGTLYDRLVVLHDEPQVMVTRSASLGRGREEAARIASLNHEKHTAMEVNFTRALSLDHYGVGAIPRKDRNSRAAKLDRGVETTIREDDSRDSSPEHLIEVLIGKDHSRAPSLNHGVEMKQDHSKALVNSIGDGRVAHSPTAVPSVVIRRTQSDSSRSVASRREQQSGSPQAKASSSKQSQSDSPRSGASTSRNQSDSPQQDDSLGAVIARNVEKFWMHAVSVGAVAVIAWVGKSLANRQQGPRGQAPRCRRHVVVNRYYWDD